MRILTAFPLVLCIETSAGEANVAAVAPQYYPAMSRVHLP
jgi:hypothetical protein